jgi:hypothetical protein
LERLAQARCFHSIQHQQTGTGYACDRSLRH